MTTLGRASSTMSLWCWRWCCGCSFCCRFGHCGRCGSTSMVFTLPAAAAVWPPLLCALTALQLLEYVNFLLQLLQLIAGCTASTRVAAAVRTVTVTVAYVAAAIDQLQLFEQLPMLRCRLSATFGAASLSLGRHIAACRVPDAGQTCNTNWHRFLIISNFLKNLFFISFGTLVNPNSCAPAKPFPNFLVSFFFAIFVYYFIDSLAQRCLGQLFIVRCVYFYFDFGSVKELLEKVSYFRHIYAYKLTAEICAN